MNLHALMQQFAQFEGAQVGRGPKHPTEPNLALTADIAAFFARYPFLQRNRDYVDFQECYAGASMLSPSGSYGVDVDIAGFSDVSSYIPELETDFPLIDEEDSVLTFGYVMLQYKPLGFRQISFGFDATQERKPGVYRYATIDTHSQDKQWHWYCATFRDWFERLIQYQGRLDDTQ